MNVNYDISESLDENVGMNSPSLKGNATIIRNRKKANLLFTVEDEIENEIAKIKNQRKSAAAITL